MKISREIIIQVILSVYYDGITTEIPYYRSGTGFDYYWVNMLK